MPWYVICTQPNYERKVVANLEKRNIVYYFPCYESRRKWSDRVKKVSLPLLGSYVLVHSDNYSADKETVLTIPGVRKFLWHLGKPCIVNADEIEAIKNFLSRYKGAKLEVQFGIGENVTVTHGALIGQSGQILHVQGNKVVLLLSSFGGSISAEVPAQILQASV